MRRKPSAGSVVEWVCAYKYKILNPSGEEKGGVKGRMNAEPSNNCSPMQATNHSYAENKHLRKS